MERAIPIAFRLLKAELKQFAIFPELVVEGKEIKINAQFSFSGDPSKRVLACTCAVNYQQEGVTILVAQFTQQFLIKDETFDSFVTESGWSIPVDFMRHLAYETATTMRGAMLVKSEKTRFESMMLPVFDFEQIITKNLKISRRDYVLNPKDIGNA